MSFCGALTLGCFDAILHCARPCSCQIFDNGLIRHDEALLWLCWRECVIDMGITDVLLPSRELRQTFRKKLLITFG